MIFMRCPDAARRIGDPEIRRFVEQRFAKIDNGCPYDSEIQDETIVVEPGDTLAWLEGQSGRPVASNPFDGARCSDSNVAPVRESI